MTNDAYAQLTLLSDRCTRYSILTGKIIDEHYAPCNWCITHSLCRGLFNYRTRRNTSYVTNVQPMSYCDTTYVVRSQQYNLCRT